MGQVAGVAVGLQVGPGISAGEGILVSLVSCTTTPAPSRTRHFCRGGGSRGRRRRCRRPGLQVGPGISAGEGGTTVFARENRALQGTARALQNQHLENACPRARPGMEVPRNLLIYRFKGHLRALPALCAPPQRSRRSGSMLPESLAIKQQLSFAPPPQTTGPMSTPAVSPRPLGPGPERAHDPG